MQEQLGLDFAREGDRFEARESLRRLFEPWFSANSFSTVASALDAAKQGASLSDIILVCGSLFVVTEVL